MSDREKLIELLGANVCKYEACVGCEHQDNLGTCIDYQKTNLADYLIANGVTVKKWIPVSERLPEVGRDVLVIKDNSDRNMAVWRLYRTIPSEEPYWEDEVGDGLLVNAASHWMPLPELPKECE